MPMGTSGGPIPRIDTIGGAMCTRNLAAGGRGEERRLQPGGVKEEEEVDISNPGYSPSSCGFSSTTDSTMCVRNIVGGEWGGEGAVPGGVKEEEAEFFLFFFSISP